MKDRRDVPMRGDRAIFGPWARDNSLCHTDPRCRSGEGHHHKRMLLAVLTDPVRPNHPHQWPGIERISEVSAECGCAGWTATNNLLRIPPEEEAQRLFAETTVQGKRPVRA